MTAPLWGRVWRIEVGRAGGRGVAVVGQRVTFGVRYEPGRPAVADVSVYAPAAALVEALYDPEALVRVLAGYEASGPVELLQGAVVRDSVVDRRGSRDARVTWQVSPVGRRIAAATLAADVRDARAGIQACVAALGLPLDVLDLPRVTQYPRGYYLSGNPLTRLGELVGDCGAQYAVVDGRVRVWPLGGQARRTADVWSPSTGLLDATRPGGDGKVTARALLRPGLRPGDVIRVQSAIWSGDLTVSDAYHEGDSEGQAWYTSVQGAPRGS